jgi:hypothetical protein
MVHECPFQDSASVCSTVPSEYEPVATHQVALVHEMPPSELKLVMDPFGLGTMDQDEPFHISVSVSSVDPWYVPTAIQKSGPLHDTSESPLFWDADVFGLGTIDQAETVVAAEADPARASTPPPRHASPIAKRTSGR